MNTTGINFAAPANVVSPFSPVGKQAVGLENADARDQAFSPVEEPIEDTPANEEEEGASRSDERVRERQEERDQRRQEQQERQEILELAARDREVRAHEQAHAAVGGRYAGAPSYTYQRGPDGVNYAVGGEVPISLPSGGDDPEATIRAAEQVRRAALAPADPSPQDRSVAASAANLAQEARQELRAEQIREQREARAEAAEQRSSDSEAAASSAETNEDSAGEDAAREQRLADLGLAAQRSARLNDQLLTPEKLAGNRPGPGSVFDQLA